MLLQPYTRIEAQIVFNRSFDIIVEYEDAKGEYVDPIRLLNHEKHAQETAFEDAGRLIPFFEVIILRCVSGSFFYRLTLDSENEILPSEWKEIGNCVRKALSAFEEKRFETNGRLFCDDSARLEKSIIRQKQYEKDFKLAQRLKSEYQELMATLGKMVEDEVAPAEIAKEFGLNEKMVKENLYETTSGKPTISALALKLLEDSDSARKLGIRNGKRLYDEIISRKIFKEFPKRKKHETSKRIMAFPTDPVQLHDD
jgi:hypothetical protein